MKAEVITMFKTSDGQTFEDQKNADRHEKMLANKERIEKFLDKHYPIVEGKNKGPSRSIAKAAVEKFLSEEE